MFCYCYVWFGCGRVLRGFWVWTSLDLLFMGVKYLWGLSLPLFDLNPKESPKELFERDKELDNFYLLSITNRSATNSYFLFV